MYLRLAVLFYPLLTIFFLSLDYRRILVIWHRLPSISVTCFPFLSCVRCPSYVFISTCPATADTRVGRAVLSNSRVGLRLRQCVLDRRNSIWEGLLSANHFQIGTHDPFRHSFYCIPSLLYIVHSQNKTQLFIVPRLATLTYELPLRYCLDRLKRIPKRQQPKAIVPKLF